MEMEEKYIHTDLSMNFCRRIPPVLPKYNQLKYLPRREWIKNYNRNIQWKYYSTKKRTQKLDVTDIIMSKGNQTQNVNLVYDFIYVSIKLSKSNL